MIIIDISWGRRGEESLLGNSANHILLETWGAVRAVLYRQSWSVSEANTALYYSTVAGVWGWGTTERTFSCSGKLIVSKTKFYVYKRTFVYGSVLCVSDLAFWRRIFFFQILAHPVFKMWVIQKPNKVALWKKRHFEEKKMEIIQHV